MKRSQFVYVIILFAGSIAGQETATTGKPDATTPADPETTTDFFAPWTTTKGTGPTVEVGSVHLFNMTPITGRGLPYDFQDMQKPSMLGSKPVHVKYYPFATGILRDSELVGFGSLVSELWILTTAYNALYGDKCVLRATVGGNSPYVYAQTAFIVKRLIYPLHNYTWQHNVAMMKLERPIKHCKLKRFTTIGLVLPVPHQMLTLLGWGRNGLHTQILLEKLSTAYMPTDVCRKNFFDAEDLDNQVFCIPNTRRGPCQYNFGAPLLNDRREIVAIYLGTHKCNSNESYGAYIDVTYYRDWIENTAFLPDEITPDGGDYRILDTSQTIE